MSIAEHLGFISVVEILREITTITVRQTDDKFRLLSPEVMQELAMSDDEEDDKGEFQWNFSIISATLGLHYNTDLVFILYSMLLQNSVIIRDDHLTILLHSCWHGLICFLPSQSIPKGTTFRSCPHPLVSATAPNYISHPFVDSTSVVVLYFRQPSSLIWPTSLMPTSRPGMTCEVWVTILPPRTRYCHFTFVVMLAGWKCLRIEMICEKQYIQNSCVQLKMAAVVQASISVMKKMCSCKAIKPLSEQ